MSPEQFLARWVKEHNEQADRRELARLTEKLAKLDKEKEQTK